MEKLPWEVNPDLTEDRLKKIASLIAQIRAEVLDLHDSELGDTKLVLGLRSYECCRMRIIKEDQANTWDWLSIVKPTGRFAFGIGNTPVRFAKSLPDELPNRLLITSPEALKQMSLLPAPPEDAFLRWFFVIEVSSQRAVDNVYFVGYTESGEMPVMWQIPLDDVVGYVSPIEEIKSEAIELPPASINIKINPKKKPSSHD